MKERPRGAAVLTAPHTAPGAASGRAVPQAGDGPRSGLPGHTLFCETRRCGCRDNREVCAPEL